MVVARIKVGEYVLRLRIGNFSDRKVIPLVEHGPYGCWLASWKWGQVGWELGRWA